LNFTRERIPVELPLIVPTHLPEELFQIFIVLSYEPVAISLDESNSIA
jgi:hypothetical protein